MAYANGTDQQPEPIVVERGSGHSVVWPQPAPQPQPES
ncbi:hypothetical protein P3T27_006513 [Kitasatospora sp. MAA19]|nr:hypothetical protein [Kitasatospora sp. MAA19]